MGKLSLTIIKLDSSLNMPNFKRSTFYLTLFIYRLDYLFIYLFAYLLFVLLLNFIYFFIRYMFIYLFIYLLIYLFTAYLFVIAIFLQLPILWRESVNEFS